MCHSKKMQWMPSNNISNEESMVLMDTLKLQQKIPEEMPTHTKGDMQTKEIELFVQRKQNHKVIQNAVQEYFETKKDTMKGTKN